MIEAFMARIGRDWLLADGATGTNLFAMGLVAGEPPERWITAQPERIKSLHRSFTDAGADIILTNTFGANARRLALHDAQTETRALNRAAARLAREVADAAGRPVLVGGSVGPTGDLLAPLGALTEAEAVEVFADQIAGLQEGGADIAWIETMSAVEEMRAAATAADRLAMPYVLTASFDTAGNTMMGISPARLAQDVGGFAAKPLAIGSNCGVGAADLLNSVLGMTAADPSAIIVAKANCGMPQIGAEGVTYSGTPSVMAAYARLARDAGARIIGGCCGTSPAHLAAMRETLEGYRPASRPTLDRLVAELGPLVSPPAAKGATRRVNRRRI